MPSKIEWTDEVWNPVTGCTKVSEGCKNCYAERIYNQYNASPFSEVSHHYARLEQPLRWKKPRKIFVCSMGDLFHEDVPFEFIDRVFESMIKAHQHTFLILTKRPERMKGYIDSLCEDNEKYDGIPLNNILNHVWLGVSVENQDNLWRVDKLLQIPAAVRFVSVEPMLGEIDFSILPECEAEIDWVICGSESGPKRRECNIEWVCSLRDQCTMAGVPFFLKQMDIDGKFVKMPELDGKVWKETP